MKIPHYIHIQEATRRISFEKELSKNCPGCAVGDYFCVANESRGFRREILKGALLHPLCWQFPFWQAVFNGFPTLIPLTLVILNKFRKVGHQLTMGTQAILLSIKVRLREISMAATTAHFL